MVARTPPLRSVKSGEKPPARSRRKRTVVEAAESGDHRELLLAMRERVARTVNDPDCPPRDLAALTRRLQDIAKEIDALDRRAKEEAKEDVVAVDEKWDETAL